MTPLLALLVITLSAVRGRTYGRCELARELTQVHGISRADVATWVCIARHESQYNTSAVGHMAGDSGDHGIFQISDLYWCSPPGQACGLGCDLLEDGDLADDVACALRIFGDHRRQDGDGFTAWTVYRRWCRGDVSEYVRGCGLDADRVTEKTSTTSPTFRPAKTTTSGKRKKLKSTPPPPPPRVKKPKKSPGSYDSSWLSPISDSTSEGHSGALGTGLQPQRPALRDLDPRSAWFSVHYDPRFLDESS